MLNADLPDLVLVGYRMPGVLIDEERRDYDENVLPIVSHLFPGRGVWQLGSDSSCCRRDVKSEKRRELSVAFYVRYPMQERRMILSH